MYKISIDSGKDNFVSFEQGDIVKAQKFTGSDIRLTVLEIVKVELDAFYGTLIDGVAPVVGMNFIRIDNTQNDDRKGTVVISATGSNTPFIDILFGQETKSRLGRLDGITDTLFPTIGGYGIYSDNVYLKGELVLSNGENVQSEFNSQSVLIQANSDNILLKADQTSLDTTNGNVTTNASAISLNSANINLRVEKNDVINQINISTEGILIAADNIEISGATTFTSGYDPTDKLDLSDAGDLSTKDVAEVTDLGTTVIVGGFLKTDLIDVNTLVAENIKTSATGQRVEITSVNNDIRFFDDNQVERVRISDNVPGLGTAGVGIIDGSITLIDGFPSFQALTEISPERIFTNEYAFRFNQFDSSANNKSIFISATTTELVYKDGAGVVRPIVNSSGVTTNRSVGNETWTFTNGLLTNID